MQSAIDSGADTVLIRQGNYPERPVVDHAIVLQGIGVGRRPRLDGLEITNLWFFAIPPLLAVSDIDFAGSVNKTTVAVHPQDLIFSFSSCSLDLGYYDAFSQDVNDIASLTFRNCHMGGRSSGRVYQVVMAADTIDGTVYWDNHGASIDTCWFRGGSGTAIRLIDTPRGEASYNRIENYDAGIYVEYADPYTLTGNSIIGCKNGVQLLGGSVELGSNVIQDCGRGVYGSWMLDLSLIGNTIFKTGGPGLVTYYVYNLLAERNVVGECAGVGMHFEWDPWGTSSVLRNNTVFKNAGTGIEVIQPPVSFPHSVEVHNNISFGNGGWALSFSGGGAVELGCNDWYGNVWGTVGGVTGGPTDLSVDPLFCEVGAGNVGLAASSPLVSAGGCGQIGALGVGCDVTATLVRRFTAERTGDGVRIVWQVAEAATASAVWLERAEAVEGQAWIRPSTVRSVEGLAVVELDRSAARDLTYWYRLVALEGNRPAVIGSPIEVAGNVRAEFGLAEVGPNPGRNVLRIEFGLKYAAAIEIDVFDVQGRKLASPGRGVWPTGTHVLEWDGRTLTGEVAPAGVYLLRYSYPNGQDRRTIVRVQ